LFTVKRNGFVPYIEEPSAAYAAMASEYLAPFTVHSETHSFLRASSIYVFFRLCCSCSIVVTIMFFPLASFWRFGKTLKMVEGRHQNTRRWALSAYKLGSVFVRPRSMRFRTVARVRSAEAGKWFWVRSAAGRKKSKAELIAASFMLCS
jgi:hypothetical protein